MDDGWRRKYAPPAVEAQLNEVTLEDVRATAKVRDAWWTVLVVDPVAYRLVRLAARHDWITPNKLTVAAAAAGIGAAAAFAQGGRWWLMLGALAYHASFVIDCMDGKLARLKGTGTVYGQWLDFILDRLLVILCAIALLGGQYLITGQSIYLALCAAVIFLNLFHQLNGQIMSEALRQARSKLASTYAFLETTEPNLTASRQSAPIGPVAKARSYLASHRIRGDVFSAIEFQVAVFVVAPITGWITPVVAAACALLLAFDIAAIAKFTVSAKALTRQLRAASVAETPAVPGQTRSADSAKDAQYIEHHTP